MVEARVGTLSGGERSRLLLAREFARFSNLLVLDEPTNDLDLETLDLLQEVISDYDGTVLIVSHDRDFLDRTVTMTLGMDGSGKVDIVAGGYADWEKQRKQPRNLAGKPVARESADKPAAAPPPPPPPKKAQADLQGPARLRSAARADRRTGKSRHRPRRSRAGRPGPLHRKNPARFAALTGAIDKARAEKDAAEERWLELAEMVEG